MFLDSFRQMNHAKAPPDSNEDEKNSDFAETSLEASS